MHTPRLLSTALVLLSLSTTTVSAAPNHFPDSGNKGGCAKANQVTNLACTVTDAGPGFVSGTCRFGFWFERVATARTFKIDQAVRVNGCLGLNNELYAPIRISK